jgi:hypothetical protein
MDVAGRAVRNELSEGMVVMWNPKGTSKGRSTPLFNTSVAFGQVCNVN